MRKLFSIKKEELSITVDAINNIASKKSPDIQHSSVKIKVGRKLQFICKNFEAYFCKEYDISWEEDEINFIVGVEIFSNLIKQLESEETHFFHQNGRIIILDHKSQFTLETMKINYQEREKESFKLLCNLPCKYLLHKIQLCLLKLDNGIFSLNFGPLSYFVARDNRKLALLPLIENTTTEVSFNLAPNIIDEIKSMCTIYDSIEIYYSEKEVLFQSPDCFLICKNHWARSINYLELCKTDSFFEIQLNTLEFRKILRKLKLMASPLTNAMDLEFSYDSIIVSVFNPSVGNAKEEIPYIHSINHMKIKLNIVHFINILQLIKSDSFSIFILNPRSKVIIKSEATYLLMPLTF